MKTQLAPFIKGTAAGAEAEAIVQSCVHCGFCTATCPTYQLLGDELDGPRGRIYLIKQLLEGSPATASTREHLDRCLVCRNCETSCPSGVQFGRLLDIGRSVAIAQAPRTARSRLARRALVGFLTGPLFAPLLRIGQALRPMLPAALRSRIPRRQRAGAWPARPHPRRMLLLAGCVQPALGPDINAATARVLDRLGIELVVAPGVACCGALPHHLDDPAGALALARRNVDAWWPHIEAGAEALVSNASGCGAMVQEYGHLLRDDAAYAARAARVSALAVDVVQVVAQLAPRLPARSSPATAPRVAFHPPCTLQHAQKIRGAVEALLRALGAEVVPFADSHLCCGSAGSYSLLQPQLATQLRDRKLAAIMGGGPELILSANVGCITHLAAAAPVPVQHWIEWLDARLA